MVLFVHCLLSYWSLFSDDWAKNAIISRLFLLSYCSCVYFCVNLLWKGKKTVYKKTDEWYIEWQRMMQRVTTNDNKWYNEWQRVTANDNELQTVVQRVKTNDNEWQRVAASDTTSDSNWQQMAMSESEW